MLKGLTSRLSSLFRSSFTGRYAVVTNTVTGAALFIVGDLVEQKMEIYRGAHKHIDVSRVG
jgi:hypothetical protein